MLPCVFTPTVNCVCLAQLLALCGSVAFWQVSHLERSVSTELRRRRGETEEREEKEKGPSGKAKVMRRHKSAYLHVGVVYLQQGGHDTTKSAFKRWNQLHCPGKTCSNIQTK